MTKNWQERAGEPGEPGEAGTDGGGTGGHGGHGGHAGDIGDIKVAIASITQRVMSHEVTCSSQKITSIWICGILVTVILGIAAQLLIVTGKQEGMVIAVENQAQRMSQITQNSNAKDEALHQDILELRSIMIQHDRSGVK